MTQTTPSTVTEAIFKELTPTKSDVSSPHLLAGRLDLIKDVNVTIEARLGTCALSISALSRLKSGDVLALDQAVNSPVALLLGGQVIAEGQLVVAGEHFGVRIERMTDIAV